MNIISRKNIIELLENHNVDISLWGKGSAKTIDHLVHELIKKECSIVIKDNKIFRQVEALSINILYKDLKLKETYQQFKDGRTRKRALDCSVAEKITSEEKKDMISAVKRGISEELAINNISDNQITEGVVIDRTRVSDSYPGTFMELILYKYDVILTNEQFNPDGYQENQDDKDTYFNWVKN